MIDGARLEDLCFGVRALQCEYIDGQQLIRAYAALCEELRGQPDQAAPRMAALLVERGWLAPSERAQIEALLERERRETHEADADTLSFQAAGARPAAFELELDGLELDGLDFGATIEARERIVLRGLHSSGGIGEVWRAWDQVLEREIALKRLKPEQADDSDNRARFFREAQITGQLAHPGIVPVYDYHSSTASRHSFYTMRFVRGQTLREVIREFHEQRRAQGEPLVSGPLLELLAKFASICHTMAYAHTRGVIHRDLKGDNVLVGDFGEVVVLDWGLAKRLRKGPSATHQAGDREDREGSEDSEASEARASESSLVNMRTSETMQGTRLGTPAYMAPEQAMGAIDQIDERTDVYGLAAILYELLTGETPFGGGDVHAVMEAVIREPPPSPRVVEPEVPAELEAICMRGLAKRKDDRFDSVTQLAAAVQGWLARLAARRRREQEREHFFDLSLDLLAIVDARGQLRQTNPAWAEQLGWSAAELEGAPLQRFVDAGDREQLGARLAAATTEARAAVELELRVATASGARRWVHWQVRALPDEAGIYLVGRDVTERRRSEQMFAGLLESAPDATCVIDPEGTITLANAQLERLFGYAREELVGEHVNILVPPALRGRHTMHVRGYAKAAKPRPMGSQLELEGQHKDGRRIKVEISLSPVPTETGMLIACAIRKRRS